MNLAADDFALEPSMAENPLEGLMSVSQQLVQSSTTESLRLQICPPPCCGGRQFRNWVSSLDRRQDLRSVCGLVRYECTFFLNCPMSYACRQHAEDAYISLLFRVVDGDVFGHVTSMGYRPGLRASSPARQATSVSGAAPSKTSSHRWLL